MRYHKRVQGRNWFGGLAYQYFGVKQKVVTMTKEFSRLANKGEMVGRLLDDGRRVKSLVVDFRLRRGVPEYKLRVTGTKDMWIPADGWKVVAPVNVPLKFLHEHGDEEVRWRGKWSLMKSTVKYPVDPHGKGIRRIRHPSGSVFTVRVT